MRSLVFYVGLGTLILLITLVASFVTVDWGMADGYGEPYWGDSVLATEGQRVITQAGCLACHSYRGQLGQVTGPPLDDVGTRLSKEAIEGFIRNGTQIMPSYEDILSDEEIELLAEWLSHFKSPYEER
ncbi:mono/diheme cytochrome c family protein [Caldalkalibacillus uzonensis]|uniref:Mono/diheme cytochrome c family protein n=1 Tax=Caldalkalibacillus uzonensis TaxID=353224 RepID=A0ABU0CRQ0_9BACI|nr:cytochrome c [Caldalkalibacillus uzonensis]MDQ0339099.1 mono/diheme cytochrome c family protein [Caldalkalibacillus uzonensis]